MHLISDATTDTFHPPVTDSNDTASAATSMPSLVPRDDTTLPTISTVVSDDIHDDLWGSLPSSVQFSDPHAPLLPAPDPGDGW